MVQSTRVSRTGNVLFMIQDVVGDNTMELL